MTIKSALSVLALAAGLVAGPVVAQTTALPTMIGPQTVSEADAGAVQARCMDLKTAADTESLVTQTDADDTDDESNETAVAGDAGIASEPALTESPTALSVDLAVVTLEDCEAGGWLTEM